MFVIIEAHKFRSPNILAVLGTLVDIDVIRIITRANGYSGVDWATTNQTTFPSLTWIYPDASLENLCRLLFSGIYRVHVGAAYHAGCGVV